MGGAAPRSAAPFTGPAADSSNVVRGFVLTPGTSSEVQLSEADPAIDLLEPPPNPSAQGTTLRFALAETGNGRLAVLDSRGRLVVRLGEERMDAGAHEVHWSGRDTRGLPMPAGVYFVRLTADGRAASRKIIVRR